MGAHRRMHGMMVMERRRLRTLRGSCSLGPFQPSLLRIVHNHIGPTRVSGMIQQSPDVMHKEGIEQIGDFLLIGEIESTLKGNPEGLSVMDRNPGIKKQKKI
jgi:hypothetical protein